MMTTAREFSLWIQNGVVRLVPNPFVHFIKWHIDQRQARRTGQYRTDGHTKRWIHIFGYRKLAVDDGWDSRQWAGSSSAFGQSCSWLQTQRPGMQRPFRQRNWPGRHVELVGERRRDKVVVLDARIGRNVVVLWPEMIVIHFYKLILWADVYGRAITTST